MRKGGKEGTQLMNRERKTKECKGGREERKRRKNKKEEAEEEGRRERRYNRWRRASIGDGERKGMQGRKKEEETVNLTQAKRSNDEGKLHEKKNKQVWGQ